MKGVLILKRTCLRLGRHVHPIRGSASTPRSAFTLLGAQLVSHGEGHVSHLKELS